MTLRLYTLILCTAIGLSGLSAARAIRAQRPAAARRAGAHPPIRFPACSSATSAPPTMGGRIDDLAVLESNPAVFYVGTATGGLWKTVNNGTTWDVLFDDLDDVVSIGDIAINPERRQHRVGRQRREQQPPERLVGQRPLQVDRRRPDVEAHGPRHVEAHRAHHRRSDRSRRGLRRGARQPVGTRRRARHLQDDRRRPDLDAHACSSTTTPARPSW